MVGEEYRPTRHDIRYAVIDYIKECDCWVSRGEIIAMLNERGIPVPGQVSVVLENMVKNGWLKKGKKGNEFRGIRYYLADWQQCPDK